MDKKVEVDGCAGTVTTFIVEPFVPHNQEFYLSITSQRMSNQIAFSEQGGVEIEENWCELLLTCCSAYVQRKRIHALFLMCRDKVKQIQISTIEKATPSVLAPLTSSLPLELRQKMNQFIAACYEVCSTTAHKLAQSLRLSCNHLAHKGYIRLAGHAAAPLAKL